MSKRRKRKQPQQKHLVQAGMMFFEAWNLGFLNQAAVTTLSNKLGSRSVCSYTHAAINVRELQSDVRFASCLETPYIAPLIRMAGATGLYSRLPKHPDRLSPEAFTDTSVKAWEDTFNFFIFSIQKSACDHISFQKSLERQAAYFFKIMKQETLKWVNLERESPCPCCPSVSFDIVDPSDFQNRSLNWETHIENEVLIRNHTNGEHNP